MQEKYSGKTLLFLDGSKLGVLAIEKAKYNSIYGMTVTNNIRDEVIFDNDLRLE